MSFNPTSAIDITYHKWIHSYINYHEGKHPILLGSNELKSYILYLDFKLKLPQATIHQAFKALEFLYTKVFDTRIPRYEDLWGR